MARFAERYGSGPLHLAAALATFAVAAYVLLRVLDVIGAPDRFLIWFGGAIVAHDLVLVPLYSLLGLVAFGALRRPLPRDRVRIAALNHLRVPLLLSGLLLLVWFPLVLGVSDAGFQRATGLSNEAYLGRWLLLSAALLVGSGLLFALRLRRLRRAPRESA
jgi:hypothetical protein